jgi:hypothetical protein
MSQSFSFLDQNLSAMIISLLREEWVLGPWCFYLHYCPLVSMVAVYIVPCPSVSQSSCSGEVIDICDSSIFLRDHRLPSKSPWFPVPTPAAHCLWAKIQVLHLTLCLKKYQFPPSLMVSSCPHAALTSKPPLSEPSSVSLNGPEIWFLSL